jgi:hypothetical protein
LGALKQKGRTERPLSFEEMEERPSHRPSIPSKSEARRYENLQWHITERTVAVTPDGVIGVSVTAVVAAPITIAISRVGETIAVISWVADIAVIRITIAPTPSIGRSCERRNGSSHQRRC